MHPYSDSDPGSLLFMAQPSKELRQAMWDVVIAHGWDRQLGRALFDPRNWHQSLSQKWGFTDERYERLMKAGARVDAAAFTMELNRVRGEVRGFNAIHWEFRATKRPPAFDVLQAAIRNAVIHEGLGVEHGNTPHVTISYRAPGPFPLTKIPPIPWRIHELLLVRTQAGTPRYHLLARWPLRPAPDGLELQGELW